MRAVHLGWTNLLECPRRFERKKRGETEPADHSDNLLVQPGVAAEPLSPRWRRWLGFRPRQRPPHYPWRMSGFFLLATNSTSRRIASARDGSARQQRQSSTVPKNCAS